MVKISRKRGLFYGLMTKTSNVVPLSAVTGQNKIRMKILGKYAWALLVVFVAWGCATDDELETPQPDLATADAINLIEQASIAIAADNENWNSIVQDLEGQLETGGQFGYFLQVSNLREYAERGENTGIGCITSEMPTWIRGQLLDIVRGFQGLEVQEPFVILCDSNLEGQSLTSDQFTAVNKIISLYGYNLVGEFQLLVNLENDTNGTSDKVSTSLVEQFSDFELAVNLVIFDFADLQEYEFLRVYFEGEVVTEIPIQ